MMALFDNAYGKVHWNSSAEICSQKCEMIQNLMICARGKDILGSLQCRA